MLVAVHVSSMKTRRSGSRSIWPSNHSRRCFRMSGRSCSIAWPVFFCASSLGAQRSGEARRPTRPSQPRPRQCVILQARCPCALPTRPKYPLLAPPPGAIGHHHLGAWRQSCLSPVVAQPSGSQWMEQRQTEMLPRGNSAPRQSPREDEHANPSRVSDPSMPASTSSTDSESEISSEGNPSSIHNGRKPL